MMRARAKHSKKEKPVVPPGVARNMLTWFLRHDISEEVVGDLDEKFHAMRKQSSPFRAKLNYWYQVISYVRPFAIRKKSPAPGLNTLHMYKSYFNTAWRGMRKNKLHATLNVAGLSVGMAVALAIGLWIWDEVSVNKALPGHDRIARVIQNVTNNGQVDTWGAVPYPLAEELRKNYGSDFRYIALTFGHGEFLVTVDAKKFKKAGVFAEEDLPALLSLEMISGSRDVLADPTALLISASCAKALFGDAEAMGETVVVDDFFTGTVAGVFNDLPSNTYFSDLQFIGPWTGFYNNSNWVKNLQDPWRPNTFGLYVMLNDNADAASVSEKIRDAKLKKVNTELAKKKPELFLEPMNRWHLYAEFRNGKNVGGRIQYVWLFGIVGVFVLVMACINFMNLTTARSETRAKEVGIRKAIGSFRSQLIAQFFTESIVVAMLSLVIAILLLFLVLPVFNTVAAKDMAVPWSDLSFWIVAIGVAGTTGLLAGSYPALYLSSMRAGQLVKGALKTASGGLPRKILVVLQFSFSVMLIIGTIVVFRQIEFARSRPMGYDSNGLVAVPLSGEQMHVHFDAVVDELVGRGAVLSLAEASAPTTETWSTSSGFDWNGKDPNLSVDFPNFSVSYDYGKTIGWEILKGRDFSREFPSDSSAVIINESAARYMGFDDPVGETIRWFGTPWRVIGVVKDIVISSPYEPVRPVIYYLSSEADHILIARINPEKPVTASIAAISEVFRKYNPDDPFDYFFIDEAYARKFSNEERVGTIAAYFAAMAIFISALGIFGLASFLAEQRTKEIGIRKVMGASVARLWAMLSKDFVMLVIIACCVAIPAGWFLMNQWLAKFTYHTAIPWWIFLVTVAGTLLITFLTVSYQAIKAAMANPVKSLRSE